MFFILLPSISWAGDFFSSLSGVFRSSSKALVNLSPVSVPPGPLQSVSILLTAFTAPSALWLAWGWATDEILWIVPILLCRSFILVDVYSGPPSDANDLGIPKLAYHLFSCWYTVSAPCVTLTTSIHELNLSTITE